jgi:RNA polymerase sigma-70 factor, ECF subfamily
MRPTSSVADAIAFDQSVRPLLKPAYRVAYMMLGDRESAEDAVQEAALKSWRKFARLSLDADARPWFMGFVVNECRNMRRSRWRSVIRLGDREEIEAPKAMSPGSVDLHRALARLSHRDRSIVLLRFYLDMTFDEVAETVGSRKAAVRSRLYRALKRLRPHLDAKELIDD